MFFKSAAALALATGFATAKPISSPQSLPAYNKRDLSQFGNNQNFAFIDGFNQVNNQQQVLQIQENNFQIVDNGFQQAVVQQAKEVLVINQQQNGFNNQLNNLFRKSNFQNQFPDQSTVLMVVNEIQVAVDDGRGGQFQQNVFAQSVVVANRGRQATQTIMVTAETIVASSLLGANQNFGQNNAFNFGQGNNVFNIGKNNNQAFPTATAEFQLFGAKPTWSSIVADPAATLGAIWQAELNDLNNLGNNGQDNGLNAQLAAEEKKKLDELKAAQEAEQKAQEEQDQQDQQQNQDQQNKDEQKAEEEKKAQEEQQ